MRRGADRWRHGAGFGAYLGCGPAGPWDRYSYAIRDTHQPGKDAYLVLGGVRSSHLDFLGIWSGSAIRSTEGKRVTRRAQLERLLAGLPRRLPGALGFERSGNQGAVQLHYVPEAVMAKLSALAKDADLGALQPSDPSCASQDRWSIALGPRRAFYDPACGDGSPRLQRVADAIRRAARSARPRTISAPPSAATCESLHDLPIEASLQEPRGDIIELRYVGWLAR